MGLVRTLASPASLLLLSLLSLTGCDDGRKSAEAACVAELTSLAPVLTEDVAQVRRGLPEGAAKLGPMLDPDTLASPVGVQKAISRSRALVKDLDVAKGTFFAFAGTDGIVVRSETDPDVLAKTSILVPFPALKKAVAPGGGLAEAWGEVKDLRGARNGADIVWAAAAPVKDDKGALMGMFVTGWPLRAYARRLENSALATVKEAAEKAGKKNPPLIYVFVVKGKTAYGTPVAPEVNAQAIEALDVIGKTAGGPYRGTLEITGRGFGIAAARAPELGDDAALVVLASEIQLAAPRRRRGPGPGSPGEVESRRRPGSVAGSCRELGGVVGTRLIPSGGVTSRGG